MLTEEYLIKPDLYSIPESELGLILAEYHILYEADTYFNGKIRIIQNDDSIMVQEKSDKKEVLIRRFNSEQAASNFVIERLKQYEKRWDGCGCKIYFYE